MCAWQAGEIPYARQSETVTAKVLLCAFFHWAAFLHPFFFFLGCDVRGDGAGTLGCIFKFMIMSLCCLPALLRRPKKKWQRAKLNTNLCATYFCTFFPAFSGIKWPEFGVHLIKKPKWVVNICCFFWKSKWTWWGDTRKTPSLFYSPAL